MEMTVIVCALADLVGEPRADGVDPQRLGARDLAHHVDIVHSTVDDWTYRLHQALVDLPLLAGRLLVQVHAHYQRLAQGLADLDEFRPGRMHPENIADRNFQVLRLRKGENLFGFGDRPGQRLLDEDMTTRVERHLCERRMCVRPSVDRNGVRPQFGKRSSIVEKARRSLEFPRYFVARFDIQTAKTGYLEAIDRLVRARVTEPHVAEADDENSYRFHGRPALPGRFRQKHLGGPTDQKYADPDRRPRS